MGCWSETCFISNLPIEYEDDIVFIPIVMNVYGQCDIISLPLYGKYDDYGCIKNVENTEILDMFKSNMVEKLKLDLDEMQKEYDKSYGVTSTSTDVLLHNIERENISYPKDYVYDERPCFFVMAHRGIFEALIKEFGNRIPYNKDYTLRQKYERILDEESKNITNMDFVCYSGKLNRFFIHDDLTYVIKNYYENPNDNLKNQLIDLAIMKIAFSYGRIDIKPKSCGRGSQVEDYGVASLIANEVLKHVDKRYQKCVEYGGELTKEEFLIRE